MKIQILWSVFLGLTLVCNSQTNKTEYFKDKYLTKKTEKDDAKYSKTVEMRHDSIFTTEIRKLSTGEVIESYTYKQNIPYGIWKYPSSGSGTIELDYNFNLCYDETICEDSIPGNNVQNILEDNPEIGYVAPRLSQGYISIYDFLRKNVIYPAGARENGISGTVYVSITINEKGEVEDVCVNRGVNIFLDKEAVRVLKSLSITSPPYINGRIVKVCAIVPIRFIMA